MSAACVDVLFIVPKTSTLMILLATKKKKWYETMINGRRSFHLSMVVSANCLLKATM